MSALGPRDVDAAYAVRFSGDPRFQPWRSAMWRVLVEGWFSRWIAEDAVVLDFGCGNGEFLNAVTAARRVGVDFRSSRARGLDAGVEFICSDDFLLPTIESGSVDVVFCSNLLEHLPDRETVVAFLGELRRVMRPEGRLLILGPNIRYTGNAYWDFFDHLIPFTHHTLREALATVSLEVETMVPRFLPYTTAGGRRFPLWLIRAYLRFPLAWRLFGAQFFCVSRLDDC
jgi:SAM-dependent methyltransferase